MSAQSQANGDLAAPYEFLTREISPGEVESLRRLPDRPMTLLVTIRVPPGKLRELSGSAPRHAGSVERRLWLAERIGESGKRRAEDFVGLIPGEVEVREAASLPNLHQLICKASPSQLARWLDGSMRKSWVAGIVPDLSLSPPPDLAPPGVAVAVGAAQPALALPWWIERLGLGQLHEDGHLGDGQVGIVLDSGMRVDLPTMPPEKFLRYCEVAPDGTSVEYPDLALARDPFGHSTRVLHLIAAERGHGFFPRGVAPGSRLLVARVLDDRGVGSLSQIAGGINWSLQRSREHQVRVVNLSLDIIAARATPVLPSRSWIRSAFQGALGPFGRGRVDGGPNWEEQLLKNIQFFLQALAERDIQPILAVGNRGPEGRNEIADHGLSVGAINPDGSRWRKSGRRPHLMTYGSAIECFQPGDAPGLHTTRHFDGTSLSAAIVSGAFLVLGGAFPGKSSEEIRDALVLAARRGSGRADPHEHEGWGSLDVGLAFTILSGATTPVESP